MLMIFLLLKWNGYTRFLSRVSFVAVPLLLFATHSAASQERQRWPAVELDSRALRGVDHAQILKITKDVYHVAGVNGQIEDVAGSFIRLTADAQVRFLEGQTEAVRESDIVTVINNIGDTLRLPAYTRTDIAEVHRLRVSLAKDEPSFIGRLSADRGDITDSVEKLPVLTGVMSPLEAIHVASLLAIQKTCNSSYQMSPHEWDEQFKSNPLVKPSVSPEISKSRQKEVVDLVIGIQSRVSLSDLFQLLDSSFTVLGLNTDNKPKMVGNLGGNNAERH